MPLTCPIVMACDDRLVMPLATALRSLAETNRNRWPLIVYLLFADIEEQTRRRVAASLPTGCIELVWIPVDLSRFLGLYTAGHISKMTYARLLLPELLPATVTRALYLDYDLLVLADLEPLCSSNVGECPISAVSDCLLRLFISGPAAGNGLPHVRNYFNAGVLLLNLETWRAQGITQKALEYLLGNPKSPFSDQDALNVACDGRWHRLDERWNFQNHSGIRIQRLTPTERPSIVHFVTSAKPWIASVRNPNSTLYDGFRSRTKFARTFPERARDLLLSTYAGVTRVLTRRAAWLRLPCK